MSNLLKIVWDWVECYSFKLSISITGLPKVVGLTFQKDGFYFSQMRLMKFSTK